MTAPAWADGADIEDEGTPDEYRVHWTLPTRVPGVRTYEGQAEATAEVTRELAEFADGHTDFHTGPFVVLEVPTDSSRRALLTPEVAEALGSALIEHGQALRASAAR